MRHLSLVLLVSACLLGASASAQTSSVPAPAAPETGATATVANATPVKADDLIICRYEVEAGTRFTHRVCMTRHEWERQRRDAYDLLDRLDSGKDQSIFQ